MGHFDLFLTIFALMAFLGSSHGAPAKKRLFSLLNVVNFQNDPCTVGDRGGTCFTSGECLSKSGRAEGSCASGFGVCCTFKLVACGGSVNANCTYLQNPGTPSGFDVSTASTCAYTFPRTYDDVCRIRLDFKTLNMKQAPTDTGICGAETLALTSASRTNIPQLCGTLTDQHMYITTPDTGDFGSLTLSFDTADTTSMRMWDIKVTYVTCSDMLSLPPDGCLQYYTGLSGNIQNLNFGVLLASQAYDICIRNEKGFCSIRYSESTQKTPDPFGVGKDSKGRVKGEACRDARIIISGSANTVGCGEFLTEVDASSTSSSVTDTTVPFIIRLETTNTLNDQTGFNLNYNQLPC